MRILAIVFLSIILLSACKDESAEWVSILKDNSLDGWHIFQDDGNKTGWIIEDGILTFNGISDMETGLGDASLLSDKLYTDFEIKFEWLIETGGNSGFMWGVREDAKYKYPYQTGPEVQILDAAMYKDTSTIQGGPIEVQNVMEDLEERKHFVGAVYGLFAPNEEEASKAAGEWNSYKIKIDHTNNQGEVVFNGILVNTFPLSGSLWDERISKSKFVKHEENEYLGEARWYDFAKFKEGHICLQDHPGKVSFRNIMIRTLN